LPAGRYPPCLAGARYPDGISIHDEAELAGICRDAQVDGVIFADSDI
jgi:predicted GTPase